MDLHFYWAARNAHITSTPQFSVRLILFRASTFLAHVSWFWRNSHILCIPQFSEKLPSSAGPSYSGPERQVGTDAGNVQNEPPYVRSGSVLGLTPEAFKIILLKYIPAHFWDRHGKDSKSAKIVSFPAPYPFNAPSLPRGESFKLRPRWRSELSSLTIIECKCKGWEKRKKKRWGEIKGWSFDKEIYPHTFHLEEKTGFFFAEALRNWLLKKIIKNHNL
jgi:hypothetical protein